MPLNILNFEERGQVSVLNAWADKIEQSLNTHTNQIGGTNFRSANALTQAASTTTNTNIIANTHVLAQDPSTGVILNSPISLAGRATPPHSPSLDDLSDGTTYNRVLATALTSNKIDTTKVGVKATDGSFPSQIVGTTAALFSYTATTTSISISWSTDTVFFSDGTTRTISSGSRAVTGLTSNTTYYFYPYLASGATTISFATVSGGVGSPAIMYTPQSPTAAQVITGQSVTALSSGGVQAITPSSGSGGGSGGGSGACLHSTMNVWKKDYGLSPIGECKVGDWILGRNDWTEIKTFRLVNQTHFIRFETDYGCVEVTPTHCITTGLEKSKPASTVNLSDYLIRRNGYANIKTIKLVHIPDAQKVVLYCEPEHVFWAGEFEPELLVHNENSKS